MVLSSDLPNCAFFFWQRTIRAPSLVTIARSADDGYTPAPVAARIEAGVLALLQEQYGALDVALPAPPSSDGEYHIGSHSNPLP
jgi:hypothetical protein